MARVRTAAARARFYRMLLPGRVLAFGCDEICGRHRAPTVCRQRKGPGKPSKRKSQNFTKNRVLTSPNIHKSALCGQQGRLEWFLKYVNYPRNLRE